MDITAISTKTTMGKADNRCLPFLVILLCTLTFCCGLSAQDYTMKVQKRDGTTLSIPVAEIRDVSFSVAEQPAPGIDATPVAATTPEARRLYRYFLEQYGKKTFSSVMANVNWNTTMADRVYKLTGKYPAMNCYDFIHICFSPSGWINYDDLTPVTSWVESGGLVQLMWHFNVPRQQGSTDVDFYSDKTTFNAANALRGGTWEYNWFYSQMDKVADVILRLQEAGIAATWRPFHEAAGNATFKQQAAWTKAWFWWGTDGADTYRQLWIAMYKYFQKKGIKNLIWVWTTQNYNGDSSRYNADADWYPGDAYVDIVARDLYGGSTAANVREFREIQERYPNKMVALGECGWNGETTPATPPANISDCWEAGARWAHFMPWYYLDGNGKVSGNGTMCPDAWWHDAMNDSHVITRDQVKF